MRKLRPGPYQIQAAIRAIHAEAPSAEQTNWQEITLLYDELYKHQPTSVVLLNKCVAISFSNSVKAALEQVRQLETELINYQPFHATKADLLCRNGNIKQAKKAYLKAIELSHQPGTKAFLQRRLREMLQ